VTALFAAPTLGGNPLGLYDVLAFAAVFIAGLGVLAFAVFVLGLPGRLAIAREHPEAEAVNLMGWAGFFAIVPWFQALVWAPGPGGDRERGPAGGNCPLRPGGTERHS
jgi:hypothetical protein